MILQILRRSARYVADTLFPARCILCGRVFTPDKTLNVCLCRQCQAELELQRISGRYCKWCGQRLISENEVCLCCRELHTIRVPGKAVYSYRGAARFLIRRFKFDGFRQASVIFAADIARAIPQGMENSLIVPLPSGGLSYRRNGWGHMETIAILLGKQGYIVAPRLLSRAMRGEQKSLGRSERYKQGKRFTCRRSGDGRKVILIDDVRTTGASLQAAADTLLSAGYLPAAQIVIAID